MNKTTIMSGFCIFGKEKEEWCHKWIQQGLGMSKGVTWHGEAICDYCGDPGEMIDRPNMKMVVAQ